MSGGRTNNSPTSTRSRSGSMRCGPNPTPPSAPAATASGTAASTVAIGAMAQSRVMTETSRRMWDLSDFLINTSDVPQPFSAALDDRHADHERIRRALYAGDQDAARAEMEQQHIVGTVDVIRA